MEDFNNYKKRRIRTAMSEAGLELLVGTLPQNILYCTGYQSVGQALLSRIDVFCAYDALLDRFFLIAGSSEVPTIIEQSPECEIYPYGRFFFHAPNADNFTQRIKSVLLEPAPSSLGALEKLLDVSGKQKGRVGLDEGRLRPATWKTLEMDFPHLEFVTAAEIFSQIRMIKHEEEIRRLKKAAQIAEQALLDTVSDIRLQMTEREISKIYVMHVVEHGGTPLFQVMTADLRSAFVDTINRENTVGQGSIIRFDVGCDFEGYKSDISRTVVLGAPSQKVLDHYAAILKGEEKAISAVRAGVSAGEIFDIALRETQKGLPQFKRHHVGHGIGLEVYDPPSITPDNPVLLEAGMVICLETPYYELGWGGVQVEDTLLVQENGHQLLTKSSRELIVIDI